MSVTFIFVIYHCKIKVDQVCEFFHKLHFIDALVDRDFSTVVWNLLSFKSNREFFYSSNRVIDGDTIIVVEENIEYRIRLAEIDAPEYDQPYGYEAKQALHSWLFNKTVSIDIYEQDHYGRYIANVVDEHNNNINYELVKQGFAWVYRSYVKSNEILHYEDYARSNKKGLWSSNQNIPPWEWRRRRYRKR